MTEISRELIDGSISRGEHSAALAQLMAYYRKAPNLVNAQFVINRMPKLERVRSVTKAKVAILRSFTLEPVVPLLRADALLYGLDLTVQVGEFNAYMQEMLAPDSSLYRFEPDVVILAVQTRDLLPDLWLRFADLSADSVSSLIDHAISDLRNMISVFRSHSQANLILHDLELPLTPATGILDHQQPSGQSHSIIEFNRRLRQLAQEYKGVYILDYDGLVARYGRERWHDEQKWLTMRMPFAAEVLHLVAEEYLRFLLPLAGKTCKALVVDLDNTLWGGVIGEDGLHGIHISAEYPGAAYQQLQRAILDLFQRGIILAICSKNNPADALEVFEQRTEMVLKTEHFAALRINWQDKAQNLREIAAELNIGMDALAFLDDNPVERQRVQGELPEVTVIDLPANPKHYARALRACPVFERLTLTGEDRERGRYYAEQRQREELQQSTGSIEDFYRSLNMQATIAPVNAATLNRVAQLTQKTNQFNLTTRRYTEQQIMELAQHPDWQVFSLSVNDRFGDNGIVGIAIIHHESDVCIIDTLLMSCRVIGRTVETALLASLVAEARARNQRSIEGWFLPTKKNSPAQDFYSNHGFRPKQQGENGVLWELVLDEATIGYPEWIDCRVYSAK